MEEVIYVLRHRFTDAEIKLEPGEDGERTHGFIIWEGFAPLSFLERQNLIHATLQNAPDAEAQQIGMLFTYTPNEYEQLQAA